MTDHVVKSFDKELASLKGMVAEMGALAVDQLAGIVAATERFDADIAARVIEREPRADHFEHEIEGLTIRILALRQPMAADLRQALAALRIANELERICDHAENIAERLISVSGTQAEPARSLTGLARFARAMVEDIMRAYATADAALADAVWNRDRELDEMYSSLFRELLTYMMEDPRRVSATIQTLFMARDIERIGDRATNIAERVRFLISGARDEVERPKADTTKSIGAPAAR